MRCYIRSILREILKDAKTNDSSKAFIEKIHKKKLREAK